MLPRKVDGVTDLLLTTFSRTNERYDAERKNKRRGTAVKSSRQNTKTRRCSTKGAVAGAWVNGGEGGSEARVIRSGVASLHKKSAKSNGNVYMA